jgi:hypothetical protein
LLADDCPIMGVVAESRLFSHPVHAGGAHRPMGGVVLRPSYRFSRWCRDNIVRID